MRLARQEDCAAIAHCARAAYQIYVERIGREPAPMIADFNSLIAQGFVRVLENDSGLIGYTVSYPLNDCLQLDNIALGPAYQSGGYGWRMLSYIHDLARSSGLAAVTLYTNEMMTENLQWYKKQGYEEIGRRREDGFNRVFFRKAL